MKIVRYVFLFFAVLVFGLKAQDEGYKSWVERRDKLKEDINVVRYYTFEDIVDSKSMLTDFSPNKAHLKFVPYTDRTTKTVYDDLQVVEGRWKDKKAVRLDRGYYQGASYNIDNNQFSAEVWFRRQGEGSQPPPKGRISRGHIFSVEGFRAGWRLTTAYEPTSGVTFSLGAEGGSDRAGANVVAKTPMVDNVWQHLVISWDGKDMKLYHNGQLVGKTGYEKEYISANNPNSFKIGFAGMGMGTIKLDIDEVVIYNRVLTNEEVSNLSKGPAGVSKEEVFKRADLFLKEGDYKKARVEYEKLKDIPDEGKYLALFNIAESYRREKDYKNAHNVYKEITSIPDIKPYYLVDALFRRAEVCLEEKDYQSARNLYQQVKEVDGRTKRQTFRADISIADTYRVERKYSVARKMYEKMLKMEETLSFPNDVNRLDIRGKLENIEGLADGKIEKSNQDKIFEWLNSPKQAIYVSLKGNDKNSGTKAKPFATIQRAQEEVKKIKNSGGVTIYLREGTYFLDKSLVFTKEDSGLKDFPVVYRGYPKENVRIVSGVLITDFRLLSDKTVLDMLPKEAKGKVYVANLKELGITDYGKLVNRGYGSTSPSAMELIYNGKIMQLARWPNDSWLRVAGLPNPKGDYVSRNTPYQLGKFIYSEDRPKRWKNEKEIWLKGYLGPKVPFVLKHLKVTSIETDKKVINVTEDPRWAYRKDPNYGVGYRIAPQEPYFVYNLLSEIDMPGEWYLDRQEGRLYFYPPGDIKNSEIIGTLNEEPIVKLDNVSNIAFYDIVFEGGRNSAFDIKGGYNNIIATSTIRNTGQWAVCIDSGWEHKVVGCDIYDVGEGGVSLNGGDRTKLIPSRHLVENNHIYRFNRFDGGYRQAVEINGIGQLVRHNTIHDSPHQAIFFDANDHIIEYNELHDAPTEGREIGAIYIYGANWPLMNRGTVIRNNFFHHISTHSSPNLTHGLNAIHIDAVNAGLVVDNNIFYKFPTGISSTQPGNYLTNNLFIEPANNSIGQGDRSSLFFKNLDIDAGPNISSMNNISRRLKSVNHKLPPWSYRYPPLLPMLELDPSQWAKIQGSVITRNVNTEGKFISFGRGMKDITIFEDNWDGQKPDFRDIENMDFTIRPGSQIYELTGYENINTKNIGVSNTKLRASWPINRKKEDIGRYYKSGYTPIGDIKMTMGEVKRVYPPLTYLVTPIKHSIKLDGKLDIKEWQDINNPSKTMIIDRDHSKFGKKGPKSYAWLSYDNENLYIATKHEPDPWTEDMPAKLKDHTPAFEVSIESQAGPHSARWWMEDMPTGPIYIFWVRSTGNVEVMNNFSMPFNKVQEIEKSIEYGVSVVNKETGEWTSETKIPFSSIGINPHEAGELRFNIGVWKRECWVAWVPTGSSVWRLENAGFIKFVK